jgi:trafficking protein particle complex subunit 12
VLEPSIYHPLSQLEVPAPFRRPFPQLSTASSNVTDALNQLDQLLAHCDYLRAAHLAGLVLVSGLVKPTDQRTIFRLLSIRYSCLELSGNVLLAAQESKSLEDLGSTFYYVEPPHPESPPEEITERPPPKHIIPFHLRIQALRLQSIGFSDPRRGVSSLYDLGAECREHLSTPSLAEDERVLWTSRLQEVGFRVINALIEMGDIDCARRTMNANNPRSQQELSLWALRKVTLCLRMGLVSEAQTLIDTIECPPSQKAILLSQIAIAEERFDKAAELLQQPNVESDKALAALAKQNLAVVHLYRGNIQQAKELLESLVDDGHSFQTLTINLATVYDLTTDKARESKLSLADKIADYEKQEQKARPFTNSDFKL